MFHWPKRLLIALRDAFRCARARRLLTSPKVAHAAMGNVDDYWRRRIDQVISSPDNAEIPRCADAGILRGHAITMHNGVRVCGNGYYGIGTLNMLVENKGVHEPQEERAFEAILDHLPERCTMLELGSYWGFYSLSLLQKRPAASCFLVEPDPVHLLSGKLNFTLNGREGVFMRAFAGRHPRSYPKTISVDSFCLTRGIETLDILHADIQGYEVGMLDGASRMLSLGNIKYVFVSTHSNELHADCIQRLEKHGYAILADVDMDHTFSYDGLIVAKHSSIALPLPIPVSQKSGGRHG